MNFLNKCSECVDGTEIIDTKSHNLMSKLFKCCGFLVLAISSTLSAQENPNAGNSKHEAEVSTSFENCGGSPACLRALNNEFLRRLPVYKGAVDGVGNTARFDQPESIAVDKSGNLYVADTLNETIRKITPSGVVTTLAGLAKTSGSADGQGSSARFYRPTGITIDKTGNLYVADSMNGTIRKITQDGTVSTIAGKAGTKGIDRDRDGVGSNARFDLPAEITIDNQDNLYFINPFKVLMLKPDGMVTTIAGGDPLLNRDNEDTESDGPAKLARFNGLAGIAIDKEHNLFVTDASDGTIRKISPSGYVTTVAGLALHFGYKDGKGAEARFRKLRGITTDGNGNLYVADIAAHSIRKVTPDGIVSTLAGDPRAFGNIDGKGSSANFMWTMGLATDNANNIYVTDMAAQTIRKVTQSGVVSTVAGPNGKDLFAGKKLVIDDDGNFQLLNKE